MVNVIASDNTINAAKIALDGLSFRQQIINQNVANIDTPGYKAQTVDFDNVIKQALNRIKSVPMQTTNASHMKGSSILSTFKIDSRQDGAVRADGNNVDIDAELIEQTETTIRYQALTQMVDKRFNLLKTISMSR